MNWLLFLFGSGAAFFVGVAFVLISVVVGSWTVRPGVKVVGTVVAVVGFVLVTFSATPLPYWLYALVGVVTVPWLAAERGQRGWLAEHRRLLRWAAGAVWIAVAAVEAPYHIMPRIPGADRQTMYIVGDSIAAGVGGREEPWPRILTRSCPVDVVDLSRAGADVWTAAAQLNRLPTDGGVVLLEIGGNDLLGTASATEFGRGLDRLLGHVKVPGRVVVMFELPLPPFYNDFGLVQRRLAAKYGVTLLPKRVLMGVLTGDTATTDSLHLTAAGHQRMADVVWSVIGPAYEQ